MGVTKIFVTICMNLCNMSPKEACNFQHLFDSLPHIQEYTPLFL